MSNHPDARHHLEEYTLTGIFRAEIRPALERAIRRRGAREGRPTAVFVAAQPAAGKSRATALAVRQDPRLIPVIGDDLRQFHPDYDRLMAEDPLAMPGATAQASGRWVQMSTAHLRRRGASVPVETTLRQAHVLLGELDRFRAAGYATHLHVLAVPPEVSRAGTLVRYTGDAALAGRWTPSAAHDAAVAAGPATLQAAILSGLLDRVIIQDRQGQVLHRARITAATCTRAAREAGATLARGRQVATLLPRDAREWLVSTARAIRRCTDAGEQDPDVLATIRRITEEDMPLIARRASP